MKTLTISKGAFLPATGLKLNRLFGVIFLFLLANQPVFSRPATSVSPNSGTLMEQGSAAFQRGDLENAIAHWSTAARAFEEQREAGKQITALIRLADAYQAYGQYPASVAVLERANKLAQSEDTKSHQAAVTNSLGSAYFHLGKYPGARKFLEASTKVARETNANGLLAAGLNNLGNLFTAERKYSEALAAYAESADKATSAGRHELATKALTNSAKAAFENDDAPKVVAILPKALAALKKIGDNHDKAYNLIALGQIARRLPAETTDPARWRSYAYVAFKQADVIAERISDPRAASYALGYLGALYADENRNEEALQLTRRAMFALENVDAPEILYAWQWQTGRIFRSEAKVEEAISAYQQAVNTLQSVRQDLSVADLGNSFREQIGPLYLELADLLLQTSDEIRDQEKLQRNLVDARNAMEQLKAAELQDYFQDDCVIALQQKIRPLESVDPRTAVIYPILLEDRTEILLSLQGGLKRFTIPANRTTVTQEVRQFRRRMENRMTQEYLPHAQTLYQWLIRPLQATLESQKIDTLVIVPDESLRTIPMAALHDGKKFLIEKYAIANTPGLNLTDPKPLATESVEVLANGLTESVQGFPPLPFVASELQSIQKIYGGQVLQDSQFLLSNIQNELTQKPYTIVHIASHGQFKSKASETFVLTFDKKLTMDKLEQFLGLSRFRDKPVELLTLSACQTAAGDDRAALGLAGIAVKAGARSAVATLWFINDQAASDLVSEFYRQLKETSLSKAKALRNAQVHLIKNTAYQHPYFWSPFLLIGNWL